MRHREPAICLRTTDYSETSQVLHFLTRRMGIVHVLGKGTKRPKSKSGGAIDLLSEGELVFSARRSDVLATLIEFTETVSRPVLRKARPRLDAAVYMAELAGEMLAPGDPHPGSFDLLHSALARLAQPDAPVQAVLAWFQWRILQQTGLLGDLAECVSCSRPVRQWSPGDRAECHFSSARGGLLCASCEGPATEKHRVSISTLSGLSALSAAAAGAKAALPEPQAVGVNRLLAYHIRHQLGKPLRMARHAIG